MVERTVSIIEDNPMVSMQRRNAENIHGSRERTTNLMLMKDGLVSN
jgi:hypothetical protein